MEELMTHKTIDESRQGEALTLPDRANGPGSKKFYIESYGCAMNFADSEVVASILQNDGFGSNRPRVQHTG